jgi:putative oxidoreductase
MNRFLTLLMRLEAPLQRIPHTLIAFIARFSLAAVFWQSGQTKIEGLAINIVQWEWVIGWPRLAENTVALFAEEYQLPLLSPVLAAHLATAAEHALPILLLLGLFTRWAALGLLGMTLVIQLLVYPSAWMVHGLWATGLLYLIKHGPGCAALDPWLRRRPQAPATGQHIAC